MNSFLSKRIKKLNKNQGFTLTELIVAFLLLSIFIVAATRIMSYTIVQYHQSKGITCGQQVSQLLLTKMEGLLEGAKKGTITINGAGDEVYFTAETDSKITIKKNDKDLLLIHYDAIDSEDPQYQYDAVDWTFDENVYLGYVISDLKFEKPESEGYPPYVYRISMTIHSPKYGDYVSTKYLMCYNENINYE